MLTTAINDNNQDKSRNKSNESRTDSRGRRDDYFGFRLDW